MEYTLRLNSIERNALLAGLRVLQGLADRAVSVPQDILTNAGQERAITAAEINAICEWINTVGLIQAVGRCARQSVGPGT